MNKSATCLESCQGSAAAAELKKAMSALKFSELDVDVASNEVELAKELHLLRSATNFNISPTSNSIAAPVADDFGSTFSEFAPSTQADAPPLPPSSHNESASVFSDFGDDFKADTSVSFTSDNTAALTAEIEQLKVKLGESEKKAAAATTASTSSNATAVADAVSAATTKLETEIAQLKVKLGESEKKAAAATTASTSSNATAVADAVSAATTKLETDHASLIKKLEAEHVAATSALKTQFDAISFQLQQEKDAHKAAVASKDQEINSLQEEVDELLRAAMGADAAGSALSAVEEQLKQAREAHKAADAELLRATTELKAASAK